MSATVNTRPFGPTGPTVAIAATSAAVTSAISGTRSLNGELAGTLRVYNGGSAVAFIAQGATTAAATPTVSSVPVAPSSTDIFQLNVDTAYVGAVTSSGTTTVLFTPGQGGTGA